MRTMLMPFTGWALRALLVLIAAAIVVVARYIVFPGAQCSLGTFPAEGCAAGPDYF